MSTALAIVHKQDILDKLSSGLTLAVIAKSLGITHSAISHKLAHDPEFNLAKQMAVEARLIDAEEAVANIQMPVIGEDEGQFRMQAKLSELTLARAKIELTQANWRAEVMCKEIYGKQPTVSLNIGGSYLDTLRLISEESNPKVEPIKLPDTDI